jgi:hypothetical protein
MHTLVVVVRHVEPASSENIAQLVLRPSHMPPPSHVVSMDAVIEQCCCILGLPCRDLLVHAIMSRSLQAKARTASASTCVASGTAAEDVL